MSSVKLLPFRPAKWASKLKHLPPSFISLAQLPTPIHQWNLKEIPKEFSLAIKRDDFTGNLMSGNKVRKLEFLFADAISKKSTCVITCGGLQSNHCRATAVVAKHLGLDCHLLLRSHDQEKDVNECHSNMLLNKIHDAKCYIVPFETLGNGLTARMYKLEQNLRKKGEIPYVIGLGGSTNLGTFGIINSFVELMEQGVLSDYDDIVLATGSGGTLAGLAVGNYLTGQKLRIHGVCVSDSAEYFHSHIDEILLTYGMEQAKAHQICDVMEGYKGMGYNKTTHKDIDLLISICQQSGVLLDYCYTFKAVKGLINELKCNPGRFKGDRILYIHTGGSFSVFDGTVNEQLLKKHKNKTFIWKDINDDIFTQS